MRAMEDLAQELSRIDGRGYKAYKDIAGGYRFEDGTLFVDHVQADPFAGPSRVRLRLDQSTARIPAELWRTSARRVALTDYLARRVHDAIPDCVDTTKHRVAIDAGGQAVIERSAVVIDEAWVEARLDVALPAAGRRVLGHQARQILCEALPHLARRALVWSSEAESAGQRFVECVENQAHLQEQLSHRALIAFVADGSILPRRSGVSDEPPNADAVVPFESPESMRITLEVPNPVDGPDGTQRTITGMGIARGVNLIVGGGYHGKSTLLRALERGVYPHVPGDGREYVVTLPDAVKVRAEDRRRVERVRITPFIDGLPDGQTTEAFSTEEASGSTSQAAGIIESIEAGASTLLMDEDTCATNLMIRDARMQSLVGKTSEPITPLLDRIRDLHESLGVSTVLVMGGCGDYLDVADAVIMLDHYRPHEVTAQARQVTDKLPTRRHAETASRTTLAPTPRAPDPASLDPSRGRKPAKIDAPTLETLRFGKETVDLRCLDQLVDPSQTRATGQLLRVLGERVLDGRMSLSAALDACETLLDADGLDALHPFGGGRGKHADGAPHPGRFARPRRHELAAALNRLRSVRMRAAEASEGAGRPSPRGVTTPGE